MKTVKILLAFALVAASALSAAAAGEPKSDVELAQFLKGQMKCESGKNPVCSLKFRGLEIEFTDMKNPSGGVMAVIDIGPAQKYTSYGTRCVMIEFTEKDILAPGAKKSPGIVFKDDGSIMPQSKTKEADQLCY
ncbi:MAG: hypothetical protein HZA03_11020 [Nitrospinae bacterium]|nr:hypothetical protein [Nitrospinota bacterium]